MSFMDYVHKVDDRVADWSDDVVDFIGLSRSVLSRIVVVIFTLVSLYQAVFLHDWFLICMAGYLFVSCYLRADWAQGSFSLIFRIICIALFLMEVGMMLAQARPYFWMEMLSTLLYTWYQYIIYQRTGKKDKKEDKLTLVDLVKMFGREWLPQPVSAEE